MITYCVRKVKSWGEEGWAICQVLGPATTDYVLITNDETRPKYGLFTDKKQADGMLSWLEHEQLERIKAYLEEELKTITAHVPQEDWARDHHGTCPTRGLGQLPRIYCIEQRFTPPDHGEDTDSVCRGTQSAESTKRKNGLAGPQCGMEKRRSQLLSNHARQIRRVVMITRGLILNGRKVTYGC